MQRLRLLILLLALAHLSAVADPTDSLRLATQNGAKFIIHRVVKGETLSGLAARYHVDESQLLSANPMVSDQVHAGQLLKVPLNENYYGQRTVAPVVPLAGERFPLATAPAATAEAPKHEVAKVNANPDYKVYVVASPQTVWHLAESFGVDPGDVITLNNLKNYHLKEGQKVKIPMAPLAAVPAPKPAPEPVVAKAQPVPPPPAPKPVERKMIPMESSSRQVAVVKKDSVIPKPTPAPVVVARQTPVPPPAPAPVVVARQLDQDSMSMVIIKKQRRMEELTRLDSEYIHPKGIAYKVFDYKETNYQFDVFTLKMAEENAVDVNTVYQRAGVGTKDQTHVVKRGETLQSIARKYKVSATDLVNWNGLLAYRVREGQELTINTARASLPPYVRTIPRQKNMNGQLVSEENITGLGVYDPKNKRTGVYVNGITPGKYVYIRSLDTYDEHFARVIGPLPKGLPQGTVILLDAICAKYLNMGHSVANVELMLDLTRKAEETSQK